MRFLPEFSQPLGADILWPSPGPSKGVGTLLKRRSLPTDLWPSVSGKRCSLMFVVPDIIAASFRQQLFKADTYASCVAASRSRSVCSRYRGEIGVESGEIYFDLTSI